MATVSLKRCIALYSFVYMQLFGKLLVSVSQVKLNHSNFPVNYLLSFAPSSFIHRKFVRIGAARGLLYFSYFLFFLPFLGFLGMVMYPTKFKTKEKQKFTEYKITYNKYCIHMNTSGWSPPSLRNKAATKQTTTNLIGCYLPSFSRGSLPGQLRRIYIIELRVTRKRDKVNSHLNQLETLISGLSNR